MKIAFIYSYKEGETWSTPMSLAQEFQARGWEVEIFSLLSTSGNFTDASIKMMIDQIYAGMYSPDIIFYLDWGRFDSDLLDKIIYPKAFWIQESGDDPQNYINNFPKAVRFDLTISPDYESTERYKSNGINCLWMPHFADTVIYRNLYVTPKFDASCTCGYGSSPILDRIEHDLGDRFYNKNGTLGLAHSEALQKGKIIVQHSRYGEITRRIFEGMACGRMILTDRLGEKTHIQDLFREGVDIVYYNDYNDLKHKIDYYNTNYVDRDRIALAGQKNVFKHHTQVQRVDSLLKEFRKWKTKK